MNPVHVRTANTAVQEIEGRELTVALFDKLKVIIKCIWLTEEVLDATLILCQQDPEQIKHWLQDNHKDFSGQIAWRRL